MLKRIQAHYRWIHPAFALAGIYSFKSIHFQIDTFSNFQIENRATSAVFYADSQGTFGKFGKT